MVYKIDKPHKQIKEQLWYGLRNSLTDFLDHQLIDKVEIRLITSLWKKENSELEDKVKYFLGGDK
jgi:chorismate-pyruvate lyase